MDVDAELLRARTAAMLLQEFGLEPLSTDYFLYLPEHLFKGLPFVERMLCKIPFGGQYALLAQASA